jgi:hypothetical protein
VTDSPLLKLLHRAFREFFPRKAAPEFHVQFYPFANINNTIRLRGEKVFVRFSDLLEGAPPSVLHAIAHILLAKLYRKPIVPMHETRYRRFISSRDLTHKAQLVRQMRGRKQVDSPHGRVYDLEEVFESLNTRFFHGLMARPLLTWSREHARNLLGHYDPAHNTIVISRAFDHAHVPRYAMEYIMYHEMLHLRHPVKLRGTRRCVHSREFNDEEKQFPELDAAKAFLKTL